MAKESSRLLLDTQPIIVLPELAQAIGLNEAIILQQVHYWVGINFKARKNARDGFTWVYNTYDAWQKQFPWWTDRTIRRTITSLENKKLLISGNYNKIKMDRAKWYRINYDNLNKLLPLGQNVQMDKDNLSPPIPETNQIKDSIEYRTQFSEKEENMSYVFSIEIFKRQIKTCYQKLNKDIALSLDEVYEIVDYFMEQYSKYMNIQHPNLSNETITDILESISSCDHGDGATFDGDLIDIESYEAMIDFYFTQDFKGNQYGQCDYSFAHFILSEDIRANCFYKTCY